MSASDLTTPNRMSGVQLLGHGGPEQLQFRDDLPVPVPAADEVLIRVGGAGINNTDINTRIGWYAKDDDDNGAWSEPLVFPLIQGADCCGEIVGLGRDVAAGRLGERVLVRSMQDPFPGGSPTGTVVFGSEMHGGFAQFAVARSSEALRIDSDWTDIELASIPCAWSTAEGMLHRAQLGPERVLITGASGGVGSAAVQLAKRRGAEVIAVAGASKAAAVQALGADRVIDRDADLIAALGADSVDVVVDLVAGPMFGAFTTLLRPGGRYSVSGAIGGPIVELDIRDLYLKDLVFVGNTKQDPEVFTNLIGYIERNEVRPTVAAAYPLADIVEAQEHFLRKDFVGKLVLVP